MKESVQVIYRAISDPTHRRTGLTDAESVVEAIDRRMVGWANYFALGQVSPGLCVGGQACSHAAAPVAVPIAQGGTLEMSTVPG